MNLDMKLKFNFNKRNRYKNICSIEGCNTWFSKKLWNKYVEAIYKYRTNTGKMTASDYTHLFGYLNPYYRSAYSIPKRKR